MTVGRAHHGDLDMLVAEAGDASRPFPLDRRAPFELEAELDEEIDCRVEIVDDDPDIVHPLDCHASSLHGVAPESID